MGWWDTPQSVFFSHFPIILWAFPHVLAEQGIPGSSSASPVPAEEISHFSKKSAIYFLSRKFRKQDLCARYSYCYWAVTACRSFQRTELVNTYIYVYFCISKYLYISINLYVWKSHEFILMLPIPIQYHKKKNPSFIITILKLKIYRLEVIKFAWYGTGASRYSGTA